jgi:hypothetical protein
VDSRGQARARFARAWAHSWPISFQLSNETLLP